MNPQSCYPPLNSLLLEEILLCELGDEHRNSMILLQITGSIRKRCNNQTWRRRYEQGTCNWFLPNAKTLSVNGAESCLLSFQDKNKPRWMQRDDCIFGPFFPTLAVQYGYLSGLLCAAADLPTASRSIHTVQHKSLGSDPIGKLLEVTAMAEVFARGHTATILSQCNTSMWSRKEIKLTRSD